MAVYLLVWGEAGNVRFMPEAQILIVPAIVSFYQCVVMLIRGHAVSRKRHAGGGCWAGAQAYIGLRQQAVYFITELALAANPADFEEVYGAPTPEPSLPGAPFRSNFFLSKIIRPIYNVVFDEWHPARFRSCLTSAGKFAVGLCGRQTPQKKKKKKTPRYQYVDIDQNSQKDKKKLKPGLDNFLLPDVAASVTLALTPHPKIEHFEAGYKTCNTCRATEIRYQDRRNDKVAERTNAHTGKIKSISVIHKPETSQAHQNDVKQIEDTGARQDRQYGRMHQSYLLLRSKYH